MTIELKVRWAIMAALSLSLFATAVVSQRTLNDQGPIAQIVYQNAQELRDLEYRVNRLERDNGDTASTLASRGERISHLETTVETLNKMIWGTLTGLGIPVMLLIIQTLFGTFTKRQSIHNYNKR